MSAPSLSGLMTDLADVLRPLDGCAVELHVAAPKRDGNVWFSATVTPEYGEPVRLQSTDLEGLLRQVVRWWQSPPDEESEASRRVREEFDESFERVDNQRGNAPTVRDALREAGRPVR